MAINLIKRGERIGINNVFTKLKVEMGWKVNPHAIPPYDLDASTFLLGENGQIENEYDFVFYGSPNKFNGRPCSLDKSVLGSIDDLGDDDDNTGEGNEEIEIDLTKTSNKVKEILFTVSIYWNPNDLSDPRRKYTFGQVRNAYIQLRNALTDEIICRYELDQTYISYVDHSNRWDSNRC